MMCLKQFGRRKVDANARGVYADTSKAFDKFWWVFLFQLEPYCDHRKMLNLLDNDHHEHSK